MFQHRLDENVPFRTYFQWLVSSFLAGNINTGGYLSCHRFVSHVTGFATLSGISFEKGHWIDFFGTLSIPLFFLLGVMISGYLTEKNHRVRTRSESYAMVMGIVAILLGVVSIAGVYDFFGNFGDPAVIQKDFFLLACLCGACGLQNAAITSSSGATVRTTHLTGLTTDLGLGLIRSEVHHLSIEQKTNERKANRMRALMIGSFTLGSVIAAYVFVRFQFKGFLFPMVIATYLYVVAKKSPQQKIVSAK